LRSSGFLSDVALSLTEDLPLLSLLTPESVCLCFSIFSTSLKNYLGTEKGLSGASEVVLAEVFLGFDLVAWLQKSFRVSIGMN